MQYNMRWYNDLPPELHHNIYERLPRKKLLEMLGMSRRYRDIAEKVLYKELVFDRDHYSRIGRLFLTVVGRPKLAKLIRSLTITYEPGHRVDSLANDAYYKRFWNNITTVRDTIENLSKEMDNEFMLRWFGSVYAGSGLYDGAQAVIICLATNLEHLELEPWSITTRVLNHEWKLSDNNSTTRPFCNLKNLNARGRLYGTVPVFPWMESLSIKPERWSVRHGSLPIHLPYRSTSSTLRVLEMSKVDVSPVAFEQLCSLTELSNVKELKISKVFVGYESSWPKDYDLRRIIQVIEGHLLNLEVLHWFQHDWEKENTSTRAFGSFKGLSKLRELKIDAQLLATHDHIYDPDAEVLALTRPAEYLPDSLEALHVLCLTAHDERIDLALQLARTMNLRSLELSLNLEEWYTYWHRVADEGAHELRKSRRKFFRDTVADMIASGIKMRVWRQEGMCPEKILFAPGYQRPWPIWVDAEKRCWSYRVLAAWGAKQYKSHLSKSYISYHDDDDDEWQDYGGDSSNQGDSDVDESGKIAGQGGEKKDDDDKKSDDDRKGDVGKQGDGKELSDNRVEDMVAKKGSDGDQGRS